MDEQTARLEQHVDYEEFTSKALFSSSSTCSLIGFFLVLSVLGF
jgi:hypothetical protein